MGQQRWVPIQSRLVRLASVEYIFYQSLHSFMTCGRSVKEFLFLSYFLFAINFQQLIATQSLHGLLKMVQTINFIWVYILKMTRQLLPMKNDPQVFQSIQKNRQRKDTSFIMIYFIKYACLVLKWRGNIISHSPNPPLLLWIWRSHLKYQKEQKR